MKKLLCIALLSTTIVSCGGYSRYEGMSTKDKFKWQSCGVLYCEKSESAQLKAIGLKGLELLASTYGISLNFKRGFCETYYTKRELQTGHVYAMKSPQEVCHEVEGNSIEDHKDLSNDENDISTGGI